MTASIDFSALAKPFPASDINWRIGATNEERTIGRALPYLVARAVQQRLDEVVGPENWRNHFEDVVTGNRHVAVRCSLGIRVGNEWVHKEDGAQVDANLGANAEVAVKGAYSDALKRAAVLWGIGRYLYSVQAPWVELDENGRMVEVPSLPPHLLPAGDTSTGSIVQHEPPPTSKPSRVETATEGETHAAVPSEPTQREAAPSVQRSDDVAGAGKSAAPIVRADENRTVPPAETPAGVGAQDSSAVVVSDEPFSPEELSALSETERKSVTSILNHLSKQTSLTNLRAYVAGPKIERALPKQVQVRLLTLIDKAMGNSELAKQN